MTLIMCSDLFIRSCQSIDVAFGMTIRCKFGARRKADTGGQEATPQPPSRAARMLALAQHIERLVEQGKLASYAAAAEALGLTRARLTQVMNLLLLAPEVQEQILAGELTATERALRKVSAEAEWGRQGGNV